MILLIILTLCIFDILQGQHDYEFLVDEDGNAISDFTAVMIK